jgi:dephospho-CoA kinase
MKVYGLTGGIASGKSLAAQFFATRGVPVLDADQVVRELTAPGTAGEREMIRVFGTSDRRRVRELLFSDAVLRKRWEGYLHPLLVAETRRIFDATAKEGAAFAIYEAALLVETGRFRDLDGLIVVESPRELRLDRLCQRDSVSRIQAESALRAQLSDEERRQHADFVLINAGTPESLRLQVESLVDRLAGATVTSKT